MSLIELQNISLRYKEGFSLFGSRTKLAIDDLSLKINAGENIGIVGGNGAGKSTLLKVLAGIYRPDSGKIIAKKNIRTVFVGLQSGFIPYLNGKQNVILTGLLLGMSRKEIQQKLPKIIEYSELEDALDRPLFTYSAGMRARLAFSVSVYSEPDLLLIDEAMGVGDKEFRKKSNETLQGMIHGDAAVVVVSHESSYLEKVCNQAIHLSRGKVGISGSVDKVLAWYGKSSL